MKEWLYLKSESILSINAIDKEQVNIRKTEELFEQKNFWGKVVVSARKPMYSLPWCNLETPADVIRHFDLEGRDKVLYDKENDKFYTYPMVIVRYWSNNETIVKKIPFDTFENAKIAAKELSNESKIDFVCVNN